MTRFGVCVALSIWLWSAPGHTAEFGPDSKNWLLEMERFANCKRYAEAVYIDMLMGMAMTHPDAKGKEHTAAEIAKFYFIECYQPYKST